MPPVEVITMGAPVIPSRTYQESLTDILDSIALKRRPWPPSSMRNGKRFRRLPIKAG
ncbi:protein of unknown function [Candidatus Hydrogenisulfobacillus filiaventi]|uniref:Uncharacterized protein n=1 Tax=Candidatus Hydrogenisulfobacillus filiaventi TaxID=2707344 RepID=A0A6F8ZJY1_9FIRM|nr:protein of unknown function [Candidatus Hydrogenisulfobacillus filiaventi]